jgi:hypothetical protein
MDVWDELIFCEMNIFVLRDEPNRAHVSIFIYYFSTIPMCCTSADRPAQSDRGQATCLLAGRQRMLAWEQKSRRAKQHCTNTWKIIRKEAKYTKWYKVNVATGETFVFLNERARACAYFIENIWQNCEALTIAVLHLQFSPVCRESWTINATQWSKLEDLQFFQRRFCSSHILGGRQ